MAPGTTMIARAILVWSLLALSSSAASAESVFSSAATEWGEGCYYESTRPAWDDMCMAWRKRMGGVHDNPYSGLYDPPRDHAKKRANYSRMQLFRFTDPASPGGEGWGRDNDVVPEADRAHLDASFASLVCTHGKYPREKHEFGWRGQMARKDPDHGCELRRKHRKLGRQAGGKLRFLHLSSCNSVPWPYRDKWDQAAEGGVHLIAGFHGTMHISLEHADFYSRMAWKGHVKGVAYAWVETMYHDTGFAGKGAPDCPVVRVYGDSESSALGRLHERYDDDFADEPHEWSWNLFIGGCDPHGDRSFQKPLP